MVTSLLSVTLVAALAPVRHTWPQGTRLPQILRFFTPGLLYSTVISVRPATWLTLALGLGRGRSSCCAEAEAAARAAAQARPAATRERIIMAGGSLAEKGGRGAGCRGARRGF